MVHQNGFSFAKSSCRAFQQGGFTFIAIPGHQTNEERMEGGVAANVALFVLAAATDTLSCSFRRVKTPLCTSNHSE